MTKELRFIKRIVLESCHPDWDWKTIGRKGTEFLGQPITLARVLIAVNTFYIKDEFHINAKGQMYAFIEDVNSYRYFDTWDLSKDLRDQEPKVILAIAKILGYEK